MKNKSLTGFLNKVAGYSKDRTEPIELYRECPLQARVNQLVYKKRGLSLKAVIGSFGAGVQDDAPPHFLFGRTLHFLYGHPNGELDAWDIYGGNFHYWLEDEQGNIYDVVAEPVMKQVAEITMGTNIIEKQSKDFLKTLGFNYIPAPDQVAMNRELLRIYGCFEK